MLSPCRITPILVRFDQGVRIRYNRVNHLSIWHSWVPTMAVIVCSERASEVGRAKENVHVTLAHCENHHVSQSSAGVRCRFAGRRWLGAHYLMRCTNAFRERSAQRIPGFSVPMLRAEPTGT